MVKIATAIIPFPTGQQTAYCLLMEEWYGLGSGNLSMNCTRKSNTPERIKRTNKSAENIQTIQRTK